MRAAKLQKDMYSCFQRLLPFTSGSPVQIALSCTLLALLLSWGKVYAVESPAEQEHKLAIKQAQQGDYDAAIQGLNKLIKAHPDQSELIYDYITVLSWAGRDELALAQLAKIELAETPIYTLEAIAKAARNQKKFDLAADIYQRALSREPQRKQSLLGKSMSLADAGKADEAMNTLQPLLDQNPASLQALETLAYIQASRPDAIAALKTYDRMLDIQPNHAAAQRGRIMATLQLGAPHQAAEMARQHPDVLSEHDWQAINGELSATTIRWGRLDAPDPKQRYRDTDKAIALLEQQLDKLSDTSTTTAVRARLDLLAAYRERRKMQQAVTLFEALQAENVDMPPYAQFAAADAYLYLRQPETAASLLQTALTKEPHDFEAGMLLFYAYLESEDFDSAMDHVDQLITKQATWYSAPGSIEKKANPEKLSAQILAAMARAYTDDPAEAQRRIEALIAQAPNNHNLRNELGNVYLFRGWPRQAQNEFRAVLAVDAEHLSARAGNVEALAEMGDLSAADTALAPLVETYFDEQRIMTLQRQQETRKLRELWLDVNGGSNTSPFEGSRDLSFEGYLYDSFWTETLRPYVHALYQEADFDNATTNYDRIGVGLHYRTRDIDAHGEIDDGSDGGMGLSLQAKRYFDDFWIVSGAIDSYSDGVSLRARQSDIDAWSATLGLEYRFHESRQLGIEYQYLDFSDNNQRDNISAYAYQRLLNTPTYKLDGRIGFYYQENKNRNTSYFNPIEQSSLELTLANEWLTYRHYERAFRQRVLLTVGSTDQQGFDRDAAWAFEYEHHWDLHDRTGLAYGISRSRAMYDGLPEYATRGFLNLYTRF